MIQVTDVIHRYLGWCPYMQVRREEVRPDDMDCVPSAGGSFGGRAIHWLGLFSNQTMLQAIGSSCAGLYMFACFSTWSCFGIFLTGMLAGLLFSAFLGIWYWRIFDEVLRDGPVMLWNRYDRTSGTLTVVSIVVATCVPALALLGALPGIDMSMTTAFFGGTVVVLFVGVLIAVRIWESDHMQRLHYDGMILKLEKDDRHAVHCA